LVNRFEFRDTLWSLTIHPHKNWIVAAFFQNQGKGLLRNYVQSYALNKKEQLEPVYEPAWYANSVTEMAFNPGGSLLAAITSDSQVHLVNGEGMKSASSWEEIFVRGLSFSPDGTWLATYANFPLGGSKITLLSLRHPPSVTPTITHDSALEYVGAFENPRTVTSVAFSPDSTQLVSGGEDGAARIWDLESRHEVQRLPTINAIVAVDHAPKGSGIAALDIQNTLHIWASAPLHVKLSARAGISFSPDGRAIGAGAAVISAQKGQTLFYLGSHQAPVNEGVFSPDGRFYALGVGGDAGSDNHAKIYDLHTRELVIQLPHTSWVQQVEFSPDGDLLATVADGLNLWDWRTGTVIHTRYDVIRTAFSSDGHVLAIMLKSGKIRFLEVHDPASERGLGGYEGARRTMGLPPDRILRFSPDGQWFTVVEGARIHLWRIHQTIL
jgi:WD40 repeat protein